MNECLDLLKQLSRFELNTLARLAGEASLQTELPKSESTQSKKRARSDDDDDDKPNRELMPNYKRSWPGVGAQPPGKMKKQLQKLS